MFAERCYGFTTAWKLEPTDPTDTRFIFNQTEDVPHLAVELLRGVEREGLMNRPVFMHLLSDTGRCVCVCVCV